MHATPQLAEGAGLVPGFTAYITEHSPDGIRMLREAKILRPFNHAPLFEPFCRTAGPALDWLAHPTNSALALAGMLAAPLIALLLLPLFLILLPALLIFGFIGVAVASLNSDGTD